MTETSDIRDVKLSVCLATHNGAAFLRQQIESILSQLGSAGELVAVDDASFDDTVTILESFHDPRIRIFRHAANQGVITTFEHALREARGNILFLCDQDDLWREDKVSKVVGLFDQLPKTTLILSNFEPVDAQGNRFDCPSRENGPVSTGVLANLIRNRYQGSTMAFRRSTLPAILPFPSKIPMHDSWIGLVNAVAGNVVYLSEPLIFYRRHCANVTTGKHASLRRMLAARWHLISALAQRWPSLIQVRKTLRQQAVSSHAEAARQ